MDRKKYSGGPNLELPAIATVISEEISPKDRSEIFAFFKRIGVSKHVPERYNAKHLYSNLVGGFLKVHRVERGRISCLLTVKPAFMNVYNGLRGGAVAAVAEMVAIACARTVVGKDKELFLGDLSISYLSATQENAELIVDGSVIRHGRNLTVIAIEFRLEGSEKLTYTSRAIFYNMPVASL